MAGLYKFSINYDLLSIKINRYMTRCACETADCDKMGFLNLYLMFLLFSCLWPLSVASPFPHILKEQTLGEGVTMLITNAKAIFSSLVFPGSLFAFNMKSYSCVRVRRSADTQAHASLKQCQVRTSIFLFFWFYLNFYKERMKPFPLKKTGCLMRWQQ